jgi:hypothetical protein
MPGVADYVDELALAWCVLLNVAVFAAAYRFASRRMSDDRVQGVLDALLLTFAVQYAAVGIPGILDVLRPGWITVTAGLISACLWWKAGVKRPSELPNPTPGRWIVLSAGVFAIAFLLAFTHSQNVLPVMSNDALTYHFPAAAQWLQDRRIDLFSVWFFNPANTYSPLAGSTFIVWLMTPFGNDILARFVEVPALIFVGVGILQLGRQLGADDATAALMAAATMVARPFINQAIMGKDDLFVVAFFISALIAMTPKRTAERFGPLRLGIALGLLLATKYTAIFSAAMLLLAIDGLRKGGWRRSQWLASAGIAAVIAGPWYLRNLWITGNPVFPLSFSIAGVHLLHGLFTTAVSEQLRDVGAWKILTANFAMPASMLTIMGAAWVMIGVARRSLIRTDPLLRTCILGAPLGLMLFIWRSPFAEVRFIFPVFAMLFGIVAAAIALLPLGWPRRIVGAAWIAAAVFTAFASNSSASTIEFFVDAIVVAAIVVFIAWLIRKWPPRARFAVRMLLILCASGFTYVYWPAYLQNYERGLYGDASAWDTVYPPEQGLWRFVDQHIPPDATVAYTNLYLIYPMQGFSLSRRLVYAPIRPGVNAIADFRWLGDRLSGEAIVPAAARATVANADEAVWLKNLRQTSAEYLVVGRGGVLGSPPEAAFADSDPKHFHKLFEGAAGSVYAISWAGS